MKPSLRQIVPFENIHFEESAVDTSSAPPRRPVFPTIKRVLKDARKRKPKESSGEPVGQIGHDVSRPASPSKIEVGTPVLFEYRIR